MHCPMDFSGHDSGKQPHNERHLTTVNKKKKKKKIWPKMQAYFYQFGRPHFRFTVAWLRIATVTTNRSAMYVNILAEKRNCALVKSYTK